MSTLLRILLFLVAWLVFAFLTLKSCIEPKCCGTAEGEVTEEVITPPPAPAPTNDYAIVSRLGDAAVLNGSKWPALREKLLAEYQADTSKMLNLFGHYYPEEPTPEGYENMGFYRANEIMNLLAPDIPGGKFNLLARRMDDERPAEDSLWTAGTFNWKEAEDEIIELDDEIIILFPSNSDVRSVNAAVDEYLEKLAQRLEQTNEKVTITGHADNTNTDAYNLALGQRRADVIRDILIKDGVEADRITTSSEGESNPVATNNTAAGRQKNRRAVLKLIQP